MQGTMTLHRVLLAVTAAAVALPAQTSAPAGRPEVVSPLGRQFRSLPDPKGVVAAAEKELAADAHNPKLFVKLSQAHAAVWQEKEAVEACSRGLKIAPNDADLLTERGHRYLPLREFAKARQDLARAIEINPKETEAYYHLGLAHYFVGEFSPAADAFSKGREFAPNQDSMVNFTNWCYAALRRAGRNDEAKQALAKVPLDMKSNPGHTEFYFNLVRFYQGQKSEADILPPAPTQPDDTEAELSFDTVNYQVGNWWLYNGNAAKAAPYFAKVAKGNVWITWGFIGSEIEIARSKGAAHR